MASAYQTIPFACTRQVFGRRRKRHLFSIRLHLNGTESVRDIQCRRVWGLCDAQTLYGRTAFFPMLPDSRMEYASRAYASAAGKQDMKLDASADAVMFQEP
jgi:hypothetical protein